MHVSRLPVGHKLDVAVLANNVILNQPDGLVLIILVSKILMVARLDAVVPDNNARLSQQVGLV